jgi:hypothetical protein
MVFHLWWLASGKLLTPYPESLEARGWKGRADHPWKTVKVFATNTVVTKANYWLSSNGTRFAKGRDYVIMETNRPELIDAVAKVCDDRIA